VSYYVNRRTAVSGEFFRKTALVLTLMLVASVARADVAEVTAGALQRVDTPRGEPLEVIAQFPAGQLAHAKAPVPAVIIGSGQGYHMQLPLLEQLAADLLKQGIAVYRFNWAYWVKDPKAGTQSADRRNEIEDFTTVLNLARNDSRIDKTRIVVAGKSLGSIIAWRVFRKTPEVTAALLLTPVCSKPNADANYPEFGNETRKSAWILGDTDPVCNVTEIYRFGSQAKVAAHIAVIHGNHAFEEGSGDANPLTAKNIDLAVRIAADFVSAAVRK